MAWLVLLVTARPLVVAWLVLPPRLFVVALVSARPSLSVTVFDRVDDSECATPSARDQLEVDECDWPVL
jgi:hypothetical protein